jgi:hypothetical protein
MIREAFRVLKDPSGNAKKLRELLALRDARKELERNGQKPTWAQVVELANRKYRFVRPSKTALKRIRRVIGRDLPNPPRGKAKKRGQT